MISFYFIRHFHAKVGGQWAVDNPGFAGANSQLAAARLGFSGSVLDVEAASGAAALAHHVNSGFSVGRRLLSNIFRSLGCLSFCQIRTFGILALWNSSLLRAWNPIVGDYCRSAMGRKGWIDAGLNFPFQDLWRYI